MRDDALPEDQVAEGDGSGTRTGPRHAAPRKSLLTRANASAGKAIAMAAMPTAVIMGMGLTPRLASADELPKNPFSGDSCVSQSDSPSPSSSASASPSATPSPSASPSTSPTPSASPKASTQAKAPGASKSSGSSSAGSTSNTTNSGGGLLGGLSNTLSGLGNTLTGGGGSSSASPTPSASPSASSSGSGSSGLLGSVTKTVSKTTGSVASTAKGATDSVTKTVSNAASALPTASSSSSGNGTPYPCPTYNAKALADAGLEQTPELLPNQPWVLKTSLLTLTGLDYHGVVKVKTENGSVKDVLKFTATAVDIKDLHQIQDGSNGTYNHVKAAPGSTSTIRNGTVTMYTQELKGDLFGLIPVTFSPDSPPPVNVPFAFFTNVTVTQAGQFGGTLTVPGMDAYGNTSPD
ncbi:hydrogenase expression protein HypF [Streptomyces sp. RB6PN25]|uniref:Hydrogenase expression protein HypF n=1 Tax=Streptomyces humicola TaxID=2953240 RepID=A0ABT1PRZ5_9ACTN|nr:hydrogenase expression protein HypF [Streptomyces humicola]MCQ4080448.1 hydrogenase expression protein HypF [Streptomyces humicola]